MPRALSTLVLLLGIAAVSTSSLLVRFAQGGAGTLAIAAGRLSIATLVLLPWVLVKHRADLARLQRRDLAAALLAGVLLALHFATWIASLRQTSVASSVVLVTTTPVWVALAAPWLLRERTRAGTWIGIAAALAGTAIIAGADRRAGAAMALPGLALRGDLLALTGAVAMAIYVVVVRRLRARVALLPCILVIYGAGAILLVAALVIADPHPLAIAPRAWLWIALLALIPQLVGHSSFNWALRHLPATFVSVALLGEPVGSTLLAWRILGETPSAPTLIGAGLTLAGVAIAARGVSIEGEAST